MFNGNRVSAWDAEEFLRMARGDGVMPLGNVMPLNYPLNGG